MKYILRVLHRHRSIRNVCEITNLLYPLLIPFALFLAILRFLVKPILPIFLPALSKKNNRPTLQELKRVAVLTCFSQFNIP